jgi:uncharacterized protein
MRTYSTTRPAARVRWSTPPRQPGYGWPSPPPPRRSRGVGSLFVGAIGAVTGLFFLLNVIGSVAHQIVPVQGSIASHAPAPATDPGATPVRPASAVAVLTANTLYAQGGLPNRSCPATDIGQATTEEQTRFYRSLMACLSREWRPPIQGAGYRYAAPDLVVFDSPVATPCGNASPESGRTLAFYCPSDAVMYADVPQMRRFFGDIDVAYAVVIGHEFGHHVQSEAGMLAAYDDILRRAAADRLDLSRRLELQASCMGGLFLGAVAESFPIDSRRLTQLQQVAGAFGDEPGSSPSERDHGAGESNRRWILTGFDRNDIAACNTFRASASAVS